MAAYTIVLTGAAGVTNVTPRFDFSSGTIAVWVEDVFIKNLVSGVEDDISLSEGEKLEYICSDWDAITRIDINEDKVSGDISGWTLPSSLVVFSVYSTSVEGDISGWALPSSLSNLYIHNTSVSGDISGWTLPSNLVYLSVPNTSVSGDISGWTLSSSLSYFYINTTSLAYDSSTGAFEGVTNNLTKIDFDDCSLAQEEVDNVLADLVTSGITDSSSAKTLDIGDNNSGPSPTGWANKLILESRGWTVKINAAVYTIVLTGASGVTNATPQFSFTSGTVAVWVEDVFIKNLTSGIEDDISLSEGEKLEYICNDWDAITMINLGGNKVSGDISGWVLPSSLTIFSISSTSLSGDISGWTFPSSLTNLYIYNTDVTGDISGWTLPNSLSVLWAYNISLSGDISGWTLPSSLTNFSVSNTSVEGDISGWTLPSSLVSFSITGTSLSGDPSGWTLPSGLEAFWVYNTSVVYSSSSGAFEGVTDNLTKIDFDNCELSWEDVDNILVDVVTSGITDSSSSKTLELGDNNSGPSTIGWLNKLILESRGWTVKINGPGLIIDAVSVAEVIKILNTLLNVTIVTPD